MQVKLENERGASASAVVSHSQVNPHYPRQPFLAGLSLFFKESSNLYPGG